MATSSVFGMNTTRASDHSVRQQVSRHAAITSRSVGSARGTRARVRKLLVRLLTRIGTGSRARTSRSVVEASLFDPCAALPRDSTDTSSTASLVTTGRGKSGIVLDALAADHAWPSPVPL